MADPYIDGLLKLGSFFAGKFRADILTLEGIAKFAMIRESLVRIYYVMVHEKRICRIEDLVEADKRELWEEAKRTNLDNPAKIEYCKAIYALNNLL